MAQSKFKLTYFQTKGFSESIRFILAYADVKFEDHRIAREEWPTIKQKTQFGVVPVLEVDGKALNQSLAICRYLGKRFGLITNDLFTDALLDALVENIGDASIKYRNMILQKTPEAKKQADEAFKNICDKIEPLAINGYFYGNKPTWADVYFAGFMDAVEDYLPNVLQSYPKLKELCAKIKSKDSLKKYIETRPTAVKL